MAGRVGYFLASIPLVAGLAVAGCLAWFGIAGLQNALSRFVVPGTTVLALDEPGTYTIFHESDSMVDGRLYAAPDIAGLRVTVAAEPGGAAVAVAAPNIGSSYTIGGHSGTSVLAFAIAAPGHYRLTAEYPGGRGGAQTVLAVGHGFFGRLVGTILGAVASVFVGFGLSLTLVLTTYFRRRRLHRAAASLQ